MLNGIRSTGCICFQIGANFAPPTDYTNTAWLTTQLVDQILSVAGANGITRCRFNNSGGASYTANTFGSAMTSQLDGMRVNLRRLGEAAAQYGVGNYAETHDAFNIGITVWDYMYAMQGIDPSLIGIDFAIGHVAEQGPNLLWQLALRNAMPRVFSTAIQDVQLSTNPTTRAITSTTVPAGTGLIPWSTFFGYLLNGGYNGAAEAQIEYSIVGANGTTVSLNNAFYADNVQFTSGNLTPAIMIATMLHEVTYYKTQALAAGWTAAQMT
jgi:sugar phosphate isomerase/epimerase